MTKFAKLGRPTGHRMSMLRTMGSQLVKHERIETIVAKAKEVRRLAGNYGPTWQGGIDQVDTPDCFGPCTSGRCGTNGLDQRTTSIRQIFWLALNEEVGLEPSEKVMRTGLLTEKMSFGRQSHQFLNHRREHPLIPRLDLVSLGSLHLLKEEKSESDL